MIISKCFEISLWNFYQLLTYIVFNFSPNLEVLAWKISLPRFWEDKNSKKRGRHVFLSYDLYVWSHNFYMCITGKILKLIFKKINVRSSLHLYKNSMNSGNAHECQSSREISCSLLSNCMCLLFRANFNHIYRWH